MLESFGIWLKRSWKVLGTRKLRLIAINKSHVTVNKCKYYENCGYMYSLQNVD